MMRNKISAIFSKIAFFIIFITLLSIPQIIWGSSLNTQRFVLDNGMTVLITEMPQSKTTAVYALVSTGSATEGKFVGSGITHFVEHMMFKGTPKRSEGEIAAEIQAVGGTVNASTDKDHTLFTITVPSDAFDTALDVLSDMLLHPLMNEFETERNVILSEMRMNDDNPSRKINTLFFQNFYHEHPYQHPVIGYPEIFKKITKEDLFEYYQTHYVPNNMIFSVAGPVKTQEILSKVNDAFKKMERGKPLSRNLVQEPPFLSSQTYEHSYPTDIARLIIGFPGTRLLDLDLYALDVLAQILGQGASSRLYESLYKNKKLVYNISSGNYTPVDRGVFLIDADLENGNVESAIKEISLIIEDIKNKGVKDSELEIAKKDVARERIFSVQTPSAVAAQQAYDEAMAYDIGFSDIYVNEVSKVTKQDVQRVANKYLLSDQKVITILRPTTAEDLPLSKEDENKIQTRMFKLNNGITVLIREDHTLPIVNVRTVYYAGTRLEPLDKIGLSQLTASLLTRGTKKYSAKEWNQKTAKHGLDFSTFSGQNSLGITLDCLSTDLKQGWELFNELINKPSFDPKELESVRNTMLAAIRQRKDNITQTAQLELRKILFQGHPFSFDPLGTPESLKSIDENSARAFFEYIKQYKNPVIAVYGDIKADEALENLNKIFSNAFNNETKVPLFKPEQINLPCQKIVNLDKEQAVVLEGYRTVNLYDPERYVLDVIADIIGSSFDGRLFKSIREKAGMAYAVGSDLTPSVETGLFSMVALTSSENADDVQVKMKEEVKRLAVDGITEQELNSVKKHIKGDHIMSREVNGQRATKDALNELYGLGYDWDDNYVDYINKVTPVDIKKSAENLFINNIGCQVIVKPEEMK